MGEMDLAKPKNSTMAVVIIVVAVIVIAVVAITLFYLNADLVKTRTMVQIEKNGKEVAEITDAEFKYKLANLMMQFEQAYEISDQTQRLNFWLTPYEGVTQLEQIKNFALEQMKFEKVEYLKAIEAGTRLSNQEKDDLKATYDSIEKQFKDNNQDIDDYLIASFGISFKMYKEISERSKIASKFSTLQISQINASDDEIKNYYDENIDRYFSVNVRHILLLTTDDAGAALDEEAIEEKKEIAQTILEKINTGESMDELVDEYSEDPGAQYNFGYYDVEKGAGYAPEFEEWALNSQPDDTGIVETDFGFHVMKTYKVTNYDDIKLAVKRDLQTSRYSETITAWVEEYYIEVFDAVYDSINPLE